MLMAKRNMNSLGKVVRATRSPETKWDLRHAGDQKFGSIILRSKKGKRGWIRKTTPSFHLQDSESKILGRLLRIKNC